MKASWRQTAILWIAASAMAETIPTLADAHTDAGSPGANFGARESLLISASQRALVQFAIPVAPENMTLSVRRCRSSWGGSRSRGRFWLLRRTAGGQKER